jgi:hypothetical protein
MSVGLMVRNGVGSRFRRTAFHTERYCPKTTPDPFCRRLPFAFLRAIAILKSWNLLVTSSDGLQLLK